MFALRAAAPLLACLSALSATVAAEPPPAPHHRQATPAAGFLGVATAPLGPALRAQLDLPDGVGLLVAQVLPDSPAAKAGIRQYDVLHKLDNQLLVNHDQLAVLVRSHMPGEDVKLHILRKAKPQAVSVTLRSAPPIPPAPQPPRPWRDFRSDRRSPRMEIRPLDPDRLPDLRLPLREFQGQIQRQLREFFERHTQPPAQKRPAPKAAPKPPRPRGKGHRSLHIIIRTPRYTITIEGRDGVKSATVTDSAGKVLHKDVPEDKWETLPEDVQGLLRGIHIESDGPAGEVRI